MRYLGVARKGRADLGGAAVCLCEFCMRQLYMHVFRTHNVFRIVNPDKG